MEGVDPKTFEYAIQKLDDGFVFERFVCNFLSHILGHSFIPAGGIKDRGIDGLEHMFCRDGFERRIYQASIEKDPEKKLRATMEKLRNNKIEFEQLIFVTNRIAKTQDTLIENIFSEYGKAAYIYDLKWLSSRVNSNSGTITTYQTFVRTYLHEFSQPGKAYVIGDLVDDPRLFVFLRQQWEENNSKLKVDTLLTDTLILFALEGTDPEKGVFKTKEEIKKEIGKKIAINPSAIFQLVDSRLTIMSTKPRRIRYHRDKDAYCLPYETRQKIQERNISDAYLQEQFRDQSVTMLEKQLTGAGVRVTDCLALMEKAFNQIYYKQGLEFSDFILKGENRDAFEKHLYETICNVVDQSTIIPKNREIVKSALMITIRQIAYNGTAEQKMFLQKLSSTYLMLFLLQCDPKVCMYFESMASKLNVYVCTSILIPAMSEIYLQEENRRHWNLLKGARSSGVTLIVNETIVGELVSHLKMVASIYEKTFKEDEDVYLAEEMHTLYIQEILIRAYFYAKMRKQVGTFPQFIDNFVTPNFRNAKIELISWLREEFGITYKSNSSLGVVVSAKEEELLFQRLKDYKSAAAKARNDSKLILAIYAIREKENEGGTASIFGYKTWWLSKDTMTSKAVNEAFADKYPVSCYMRPDFLYNYISLAPRPPQVSESYSRMFPTLLGVNISFHLPSEIVQCVHKCLKEHRGKNSARRSAILLSLAEQLKSDSGTWNRTFVKHYLDEELSKGSYA